MENIKIKISTHIDGSTWTFSGDGTKTSQINKTILQAEEYVGGETIKHRIEFSSDYVKISRFSDNTTHLSFYPQECGDVYISTPFGKISGVTTTHKFAIKTTPQATHITLSYSTDFDAENADVKKMNISFFQV